MTFNLTTDEEFKLTKEGIEDDIDALIDSSKNNLRRNIEKEIKDEKLLDETMNLIYEDLEKKRKDLKKHFISQLETMTVEAYENALSLFSGK